MVLPEQNSSDRRASKASSIVKTGATLTFVDVGTFGTEELDHFLGAKGRGPVEQGLAHVVHEVHLHLPSLHALDQGVCVLASDAVDQLPVSLLTLAVHSAQACHPP